jgi:NAD-dependent DNA ligase
MNMIVVFTGAHKSLSRAQLAAIAAEAGFTVKSSVTTKTNLVVAGSSAYIGGRSTKVKEAKARGVPVTSYTEFERLYLN